MPPTAPVSSTLACCSDLPGRAQVRRLHARIGWHKAEWQNHTLRLRPGMEIDLGGIGKEYAVDRAAAIATELEANCLINFGGDLRAQGPGANGAGMLATFAMLHGQQAEAFLESQQAQFWCLR